MIALLFFYFFFTWLTGLEYDFFNELHCNGAPLVVCYTLFTYKYIF